jgi:hypothetical protein
MREKSVGLLRPGIKGIALRVLQQPGQAGQPVQPLVAVESRLEHGASLAALLIVILQPLIPRFVLTNRLANAKIRPIGWTTLALVVQRTNQIIGAPRLVKLVLRLLL